MKAIGWTGIQKYYNNKKKMCENNTDRHRQSYKLQKPTKKKTMDTRKKATIHTTNNLLGGNKCKKKIPSLLKLNIKMNATPEEKLLERKRRFQLQDSDCSDLIKRKVPIKARLSKKPEQRQRRTDHKKFREIPDRSPVSYKLRRRDLRAPRLRVDPLIAQTFKRNFQGQKSAPSSPEPERSVSIVIDYNHKDKDTEPNIEELKKDQQKILQELQDIEAFTRRRNKKVNKTISDTNRVSDSSNNCVKAKATPVSVNKVIKGQNLNDKEIQKIRSRRRSQVLEALHKTEKRISRRKIGVWITNRPDPPEEIESYGPSPCVGFDQYELQEFYYYKKLDEEDHFNDHEFGDAADAETELSDWSSTSSPSRTETQISSTCKTPVEFDILKTIKLEPLTEAEAETAETKTEPNAGIGKVPPVIQKHAEASKPNQANIETEKIPILNKKSLKNTKINLPNPLPVTTTTTTAVVVYNPNSNPSSKEKEILEETRTASLSLRNFIAKLNLNLMAINREKKLWLPRKLDLDNYRVVEECDSSVTIKVECDDDLDLKKEQDQNYPDEDLVPATAGLKKEGNKEIHVPH